MNIFAIGDIHGCLTELTILHKKILSYEKFDVKNDLIIYLGDYIDRGKNSKEVINQILKLKKKEIKTINLMGNHDEFMIDFLFNKKNNIKNWLNFGLDQTIRSYGIEVVDFIKNGFEPINVEKGELIKISIQKARKKLAKEKRLAADKKQAELEKKYKEKKEAEAKKILEENKLAEKRRLAVQKKIIEEKKINELAKLQAEEEFKKKNAHFYYHMSIISFNQKILKTFTKLKKGELESIEGIELMRAIENDIHVGTFEINDEAFSVDIKEDYLKAISLMPKDPIRKLY